MTRLTPLVPLLALALFSDHPATAADRSLDTWFETELVPYVAGQLSDHPRFKGESVMFVALEDNAPAPVGSTLALSLRDRLLDAALRTPGIIVGSRQGPAHTTPGTGRIDCTLDDVHYYIGLDISTDIDGRHRVRVRALDLEDRGWVAGFGVDWHGRLTTAQRRALRETRVDDSFRGTREAPFSAGETDLLAARLAHDLGCSLLRGTAGSYYVSDETPDDVMPDGTVRLIGKHLASADVLELTDDDDRINARLSGEAHPVEGALYQYWVTVTPLAADDDIESIGASAYVLMPGLRLAAGSANGPPPATEFAGHAMLPLASAGLLGTLYIAKPPSAASCHAGNVMHRTSAGANASDCTLLTVDSHVDAVLFFLEHQAGYGLVRLGGSECRDRTAARVAVAGGHTRLPISPTAYGTARSRPVDAWSAEPHADTYYAIAVTDARVARRFANLIDRLPLRCTGTLRPGLVDAALRQWLDEFSRLWDAHAGLVDWRAIEVSDVL